MWGFEGWVTLRGLELHGVLWTGPVGDREGWEWHSAGHLTVPSVPGLGPGWVVLCSAGAVERLTAGGGMRPLKTHTSLVSRHAG